MRTRTWKPRLPKSWPCLKCGQPQIDMQAFIVHLSAAHPELAEGPLLREED